MLPSHPESLPTITIITPSLNQGDFIKNTIDSILDQDYPAVEYQVRDGGSTDKTLAILKSYREKLRWFSEPDTGQANAINRGWTQSQGEIVAWLNADDYFDPGALRRVGTYFKDHPEVDVLYGDCDIVDYSGKVLQSYPTQPFDYTKLILFTVNFLPQPATFLRRSVLQHIGYLDESLHYVMDFDYWLRAGKAHRFAFLPERLACLRTHDQAKSIANLGRFGKELVRTYERFFSSPDLPEKIGSLKSRAMSNIYYRAADCSFWAGQLAESRGHALKSWMFYPLRLRRLWFYLALGQFGRDLAERRTRNPYLFQV